MKHSRRPSQALADLDAVLHSGRSCKVIALERGIKPAGLSNNVRKALDHLGLVGVPLRVARARLGAARAVPVGVTPRQREVLELQAAGLTYSEIAERLGVSPRTVQRHVGNARERNSA